MGTAVVVESGDDWISEYVIRVLQENACPRPAVIHRSDVLMEIGLDSLEDVQSIMQMEDELKIEISDEDYMPVRTVQEMIDLVRRKVSEREA